MAILAECPICRKKQGRKNRVCKCGADLVKAKRSNRVRYWISYYLPNGKQRRELVKGKGLDPTSIEDARKMHSKRVVQKIEEQDVFDIKPQIKMTFDELAKWYLGNEKVKALASFKTIQTYVNKFLGEFGDIKAGEIRLADLEDLQEKRRKEGKKPKTIDDEIRYVKTMIIKAFDNDLVGGDTLKAFKRVRPMLKRNANARDRILDVNEYQAILKHSPRHLKDILVLGYWTGMRKGEILKLKWDKVNLQERMIRLAAEDTKEGKPKSIPICEEAYKTLSRIPRPIHNDHVFLFNGKPIGHFTTALKTACKEAGVLWGREVEGGFIFHDLRHGFVTDMRKAGVSKSVRMSITGHAPKDMDDRYNRVDDQDKIEAVRQLEAFRFAFSDQNSDQSAESKS
jgi:integrase